DVMERLVANANRLLALEPGEMLELYLRRVVTAGDRVHRLQLARTVLGEVAQVDEETLHLVRVPEPLEGVEREVRVAQPAVPVIPRPARARMLGEARGRRREQGAGVLVLGQLEHERRPDDFTLVVARHACPRDPEPPVVERALEKALRRLLE